MLIMCKQCAAKAQNISPQSKNTQSKKSLVRVRKIKKW